VIQPGGSLRDDEMIVASTGLTMRAKKAAGRLVRFRRKC
jgi:AICAR transformylase/IMP cyclohydrolase PurH